MLLKAIKESLNEILILYSKNELEEHDVLNMINEAVHHNYVYKPCMWELFFIQALEINKVPKNKYFVLSLFKINDREDILEFNDIREKVLKKLNLKKSLAIYIEWVDRQNYDEYNIKKNIFKIEEVREMILEEFNEKRNNEQNGKKTKN